MYLLENPVLQRELLVNLRMSRSFLLLLGYQAALGAVVYFAWPQDSRLDLTQSPTAAKNLIDLFFLGQYILTALMAPSFAAGSITGEKERKTYEMMLASPLRPTAIVLGKLLASLTHLGILVFASLPVVMLCLPLGGVSFYEVLAAYLGLILSVMTFGMISVACSSFFYRTSASLVVSYLLILPLAIAGAVVWRSLADYGEIRLFLVLTLLPAGAIATTLILFFLTSVRLLHPPDVGSMGKDVVDLEEEAKQAVGLVIEPNKFPDRLFAPGKRTDLLDDDANPIYDKEIRSEIFSQGTLMLRLVIQISMLLAFPLVAVCLYIFPSLAGWYVAYLVLFNMLVGPVYSSGAVCSERERQTMDLLLVTLLTPWQILWGKLLAGLRVSTVLTLFLLWPVLLAAVLVDDYWGNWLKVLAYVSIIPLTCLTTAMIALFCSVIFQKTSTSMIAAYFTVAALFCLPPAAAYFSRTFFPNTPAADFVEAAGSLSPFSAIFSLPLDVRVDPTQEPPVGRPWVYFGYVGWTLLLNLALFGLMLWFFKARWRVSTA